MRIDGRKNDELRPVKFEIGYLKNHQGSVMISMGATRVLVVVTSEPRVPPHRFEIGGWLSAEYNMLPGSTSPRMQRPISKLKNDGRAVEISRLIGRSLRQAVNLDALGQRTLLVDCDVIEADAGTRCAAITGAYVALSVHVANLLKAGQIKMATLEDIVVRPIAAISLGVIKGEVLLDLGFQEDQKAGSDCNIVGTSGGQLIDFQCTAEQKPFTKAEIDRIYELGSSSIAQLIDMQHQELFRQAGIKFFR